MYNEDNALTDEELDTSEGKQLAETEAEDSLDDDDVDIDPPHSLPHQHRRREAQQGCPEHRAVAQDGSILIENLYYYKDAKMAHSSSPEAVHGAEDAFAGPPFASLDEDLQLMVERYLEERGIAQAMAIFVPDYLDVKEQREYQAWLKNVKGFVEA